MELLVKNLIFTGLAPGVVAGLVPWLLAGGGPVAGGGSRVLALLLFGVGIAIYSWCVWDFASFGRGTPASIDAPRHLVVRGLYRFSRNPMYLGVLTVVLGWAALFAHATLIVYAICVFIAFHCFVVFYEEPHLAQLFGDEYAAYLRSVGRWIGRP